MYTLLSVTCNAPPFSALLSSSLKIPPKKRSLWYAVTPPPSCKLIILLELIWAEALLLKCQVCAYSCIVIYIGGWKLNFVILLLFVPLLIQEIYVQHVLRYIRVHVPHGEYDFVLSLCLYRNLVPWIICERRLHLKLAQVFNIIHGLCYFPEDILPWVQLK